jgi:hypothetical protein
VLPNRDEKTKEDTMADSTELYRAVMWEVRKQILDLGLTMNNCDTVSGLDDGYTAKMLHPDTPSGRQAGWQRLQYLLDTVYAGGFILSIKPRADLDKIRAAINRKLAVQGAMLGAPSIAENARLRGVAAKVPIGDYARFAGRKGAAARNANLSARQRSRIAQRAARARWRKPTVAEIAGFSKA